MENSQLKQVIKIISCSRKQLQQLKKLASFVSLFFAFVLFSGATRALEKCEHQSYLHFIRAPSVTQRFISYRQDPYFMFFIIYAAFSFHAPAGHSKRKSFSSHLSRENHLLLKRVATLLPHDKLARTCRSCRFHLRSSACYIFSVTLHAEAKIIHAT